MKKHIDQNLTKLKFGFYFKKLSLVQIILLSSIILTECFLLYLNLNKIEMESVKVIGSITLVVIWWLPLGSGIANHFRNIWFNLSWLSICILWANIHKDLITSILPVLIYTYLNIARLAVKCIFKYEPIYMLVGKFPHYGYNKIENRESNKEDFIFSGLVFIIGALISMLIEVIV